MIRKVLTLSALSLALAMYAAQDGEISLISETEAREGRGDHRGERGDRGRGGREGRQGRGDKRGDRGGRGHKGGKDKPDPEPEPEPEPQPEPEPAPEPQAPEVRDDRETREYPWPVRNDSFNPKVPAWCGSRIGTTMTKSDAKACGLKTD